MFCLNLVFVKSIWKKLINQVLALKDFPEWTDLDRIKVLKFCEIILAFINDLFSGASPVITSHANLATINQDENDESMTAVAITLEGKYHEPTRISGCIWKLLKDDGLSV